MFYIKTLSFMKTRLIFLLPLLWMLIGCSDSNSDSATLEISQSTFDNINSEGSIIKVSVTCNSTWRTISNQSWCIPNLQNGSNDGELVLTIHANTTSKERSATVTTIAKKTNNIKYINCVKYIQETINHLKANSNYDMSIDYMLFKIWEEVHENNSRS